jgi:hypothetical protein
MARTCSFCSRPLNAVAKRCVYCGHDQPQAESAATLLGDGQFTLSCDNGCGRKNRIGRDALLRLIERDHFACPYCSAQMTLPDDVVGMLPALRACARRVQGAAQHVAQCSYCALTSIVPNAALGIAAVGPLFGGTAVNAARVESVLTKLPRTEIGQLAGAILCARVAKAEATADEVEKIVESLVALDRWQPAVTHEIALPLCDSDAEVLVPRAIFGASECAVFRSSDHTSLLAVIARQQRWTGVDAATALNAVAALTAAAYGVNLPGMQDTGERTETQQVVQLHIVLRNTDDALTMTVSNQIDQRAPSSLSAKQLQDLNLRLTVSRDIMQRYFLVAALFGTSCRGTTAFATTPAAVESRLDYLAISASAVQKNLLHARPPATFAAD